jgi:hypothetical protein
MTTAAPTAALATIQPAFTDAERVALVGFLAGYRGLTREAYALDLRQFTTWCRARSLALFAVRRADVGRTLPSGGHDRQTAADGRNPSRTTASNLRANYRSGACRRDCVAAVGQPPRRSG